MPKPSVREATRVNWRGLYADNPAAAAAAHEALWAFDRGEATPEQQQLFKTVLKDMFFRWESRSLADDPRVQDILEARRALWDEYRTAARTQLKQLVGETDDG